MPIADLLIHINETLGPIEHAALENELRDFKGVIAPRFNKETPHLLLVIYDPQEIDACSLLSRVSANGYTAQLVGM